MKIEIAEPGRMTQSGSSLLKLIQNNNMPIRFVGSRIHTE